jgi:hypothetical protein
LRPVDGVGKAAGDLLLPPVDFLVQDDARQQVSAQGGCAGHENRRRKRPATDQAGCHRENGERSRAEHPGSGEHAHAVLAAVAGLSERDFQPGQTTVVRTDKTAERLENDGEDGDSRPPPLDAGAPSPSRSGRVRSEFGHPADRRVARPAEKDQKRQRGREIHRENQAQHHGMRHEGLRLLEFDLNDFADDEKSRDL